MNEKLLINYFYYKSKLAPYRFNKLDFKKWQDKKAREIVKFAYLRSPFYHNLYQNMDIRNWKNLPIIDRKIFAENFSSLNTQGVSYDEALGSTIKQNRIKNLSVTASAGTAGQQALFLLNSLEESRRVGSFLARAIPFGFSSHQKMALFMRLNPAFYRGLKIKNIQFKYFDLIKTVQEQIIELEKYRPTVLIAPPSILRIIANLKREMRLRLQPKKIFSIGEVLEPIDQDFIECAFGRRIDQIYHATEGILGITCSKNMIHLNEDLILVQEEDLGRGRYLPIITSLFNEVQPIIRYRLDDVLIRGENRCSCGSYFRTVEKIECRKEDVFVFYDSLKNHRINLYPSFIREVILMVSDQIEEYRVIQDYANQLRLQLKTIEGIDISDLEFRIQKYFNDLFKQYNIAPFPIEITYGIKKEMPFTKVKRIERSLPLEF